MITERQLGSVSRLIRSMLTQSTAQSNQAVFLATDSKQALDRLTFLLKPIKVGSNKHVIRGHSTGANQTIVASSLTDLFPLTRSSTFIGVKRSGFSKVAIGISNPKKAKLIPVQREAIALHVSQNEKHVIHHSIIDIVCQRNKAFRVRKCFCSILETSVHCLWYYADWLETLHIRIKQKRNACLPNNGF